MERKDIKRKLAVVLVSGGMDSALCIALAKKRGFELAALHLNYGQKTEKRELQAFEAICDYYKIKRRLVVDVSYLKEIGSSSLTDELMDVTDADLDSKEIPTSYVPFRNANLLAISTSWAEAINASAIFIGAIEADGSGYPDCRKLFFDSFQKAIRYGTKPETRIKIYTPLLNYTKKDIVRKGTRLGVPLHLTWSCYKSENQACGVCDSCVLRLRGFEEAGIKDPIEYKV